MSTPPPDTTPERPPPPGHGRIILHAHCGGGAINHSLKGKAFINHGQPIPLTWEQAHPIDLPVGHHHIQAECRDRWTFGQADIDVTVNPGQTTHLWYTSPRFTHQNGRIGYEPQEPPKPGCLFYLVMIVIGGTVVLGFIACIIALIYDQMN